MDEQQSHSSVLIQKNSTQFNFSLLSTFYICSHGADSKINSCQITQKMKWSTEAYSAVFTLFFHFVPHTVRKRFKLSALHRLTCFNAPSHTCRRVAAIELLCSCMHSGLAAQYHSSGRVVNRTLPQSLKQGEKCF